MTLHALPTHRYTVGEVAAQAGVAASAVRFYEDHGLISAERTPGGQRRFDDDAACLIKVARVAQRVGLTVREIRDMFALLPDHPTPQDWAGFTRALIAEAEARTAELRRCLDDLGSGTKVCELPSA